VFASEAMSLGIRTVDWGAGEFSIGIYFVNPVTESKSQFEKVVLV